MRKFKADSRVGLNLAALGPVLPSKVSADVNGRAVWLQSYSSPSTDQKEDPVVARMPITPSEIASKANNAVLKATTLSSPSPLESSNTSDLYSNDSSSWNIVNSVLGGLGAAGSYVVNGFTGLIRLSNNGTDGDGDVPAEALLRERADDNVNNSTVSLAQTLKLKEQTRTLSPIINSTQNVGMVLRSVSTLSSGSLSPNESTLPSYFSPSSPSRPVTTLPPKSSSTAPFMSPQRSSPKNRVLPRLVIGADNDFIVDREGVLETAKYFGVDPVFIPDLYHDVMLGPKWNITAAVISDWLGSVT